jgi:Uma2 family endonuclease
VLDSSTGYRLPSGNVRSPDVSFVSAARLPAGDLPAGFAEFAPDLAVEVLSPEDREREVLEKVGEYLGGGVRLVWVIDPEKGTAAVFRSLTDVRRIEPGTGALDGEDVVPGFSCPVADLLP